MNWENEGSANKMENTNSEGKCVTIADSISPQDQEGKTENDMIVEPLNMPDGAYQCMELFTSDNAQLFFVDADGTVSTPNQIYKLTVYKLQMGDTIDKIVFRANNWAYMLSSLLHQSSQHEVSSSDGMFVFDDSCNQSNGGGVVLLLPKVEFDALEEILFEQLGNQSRRSSCGIAASTTEKAKNCTNYIAQLMIQGSQKIASYINSTTENTLMNVETKPIRINHKVEKAANVVHKISEKAFFATSSLSRCLVRAAYATGRRISPYFYNLLEDKVSPNIVEAAGNIYDGVNNLVCGAKDSISIVGKSIASNTVKIVKTKYGESAGHLTSDVVYTLGNVYATRKT